MQVSIKDLHRKDPRANGRSWKVCAGRVRDLFQKAESSALEARRQCAKCRGLKLSKEGSSQDPLAKNCQKIASSKISSMQSCPLVLCLYHSGNCPQVGVSCQNCADLVSWVFLLKLTINLPQNNNSYIWLPDSLNHCWYMQDSPLVSFLV